MQPGVAEPSNFRSDETVIEYGCLGRLTERQLQQKLEKELKIRDGALKLLSASKGSDSKLECAKNLLVSNSRLMQLMSLLQKTKTARLLGVSTPKEQSKICKGKLAISEIRMPLLWKNSEYFQNKGDHNRYAVFCLVEVANEIQDTDLLIGVDRSMSDVSFPDALVFDNVSPDFQAHLEVYCYSQAEDPNVASTQQKLKKKITTMGSSIGRSMGKRLGSLKESDLDPKNNGTDPKFEQIGRATLTLSDVSDNTSTYTLQVNSPINYGEHMDQSEARVETSYLPLFDYFSCCLAAVPYCETKTVASGPLGVYVDNTNLQTMWSKVISQKLSCWDNPELDGNPIIVITMNKETELFEAENTGKVKLVHGNDSVSIDVNEFQGKLWRDKLMEYILDQKAWANASDVVVYLPEPTRRTISVCKNAYKKQSIYEELTISMSENCTPSVQPVIEKLTAV